MWYYEYGFEGPALSGHQRVRIVRPGFSEERLAASLRRNPGSWWLVGNEPNDPYQDDLSPGSYAAFYHRFVRIARRADPSCRIAPAGIANADWRWAEAFCSSYQGQYGRHPRPDAWNIHNYILEPDRHQMDLGEFQRRIRAFRDWMERVGEGHKPLLLTEFGAPYGTGRFGRPPEDAADIIEFIGAAVDWLDSTDYVQCWAWFANSTSGQFNGDLYDDEGWLTRFGEAYFRATRNGLLPGVERHTLRGGQGDTSE